MAKLPFFTSLLAAVTVFTSVATAQIDPELTGTWTTKSRKVLTGPVRTHSRSCAPGQFCEISKNEKS